MSRIIFGLMIYVGYVSTILADLDKIVQVIKYKKLPGKAILE